MQVGVEGVAFALGVTLEAIWPRRAQRELLLDLGERKGWTDEDAARGLQDVASWLVAEGVVSPTRRPAARRAVDVETLKADLASLVPTGEVERVAGTSELVSYLAPAAGVAPKTLSNSLIGGLRSARSDHRWLLAIRRVMQGHGATAAWVFHRRTPAALAEALASTEPADAADALVLSSVMALWQRRRPTGDARGNRGRRRPRRLTPKPVAAMRWELMTPRQLGALVEVATRMGDERGAALGLLGVECALTEAHLAPHAGRGTERGASGLERRGEPSLVAVENALEALMKASLVGPTEGHVYAYRIARMRAWRDRRPHPEPAAACSDHPYVAACRAIDVRRAGDRDAVGAFASHAPGIAMLLPQLRAAGARIVS